MALGFDGLAAPAHLLADCFVEGDGAVGDGEGPDYGGETVVSRGWVLAFDTGVFRMDREGGHTRVSGSSLRAELACSSCPRSCYSSTLSGSL